MLINFACILGPVLAFGIVDAEYDKETLLRNPFLYQDGQEKMYLS